MTFSNKQNVDDIRNSNEDFEFYPTTIEIVQAVKNDLNSRFNNLKCKRAIDFGAGDGRVLNELFKSEIKNGFHKVDSEHQIHLLSVEKSTILVSKQPNYIFNIEFDFHQTNLLTLNTDIAFCNPPYLEFKQWMIRILTELNSQVIYFVVPSRWSENKEIQDIISLRKLKQVSLGNFDFLNADRKARCNVEVIAFSKTKDDSSPLTQWIKNNFDLDVSETKSFINSCLSERIKLFVGDNQLVSGSDYIDVLVSLYDKEVTNLLSAFKTITQLDNSILELFDLDLHSAAIKLNNNINTIRNSFWQELFNNLPELNKRFNSSVFYHLQYDIKANQKNIEFNKNNIRSFVTWILKNSEYYDKLMVDDLLSTFISAVNVDNYKSNKSRFISGDWNYYNKPSDFSHFKFKTKRLVLKKFHWKNELLNYNKLSSSASFLLEQLLTVANIRGFKQDHRNNLKSMQFEYNTTYSFDCCYRGETRTLFECKFFKVGSIHFHFDYDFIMLLNIELGLKYGWVVSPQDISDEFDISIAESDRLLNMFNSKNIDFNKTLSLDFDELSNNLNPLLLDLKN